MNSFLQPTDETSLCFQRDLSGEAEPGQRVPVQTGDQERRGGLAPSLGESHEEGTRLREAALMRQD